MTKLSHSLPCSPATTSPCRPPPRREVAQALTQRKTSFTDHANRPAYILWTATGDDNPGPPNFSFQVYTSPVVSLTSGFPADLFANNFGAWRIEIYELLPALWAFVEHQRLERLWRKACLCQAFRTGAQSATVPSQLGTDMSGLSTVDR